MYRFIPIPFKSAWGVDVYIFAACVQGFQIWAQIDAKWDRSETVK